MDLGLYSRRNRDLRGSAFDGLPLYADDQPQQPALDAAPVVVGVPESYLRQLTADPRTASHPWVQKNLADQQLVAQQLEEIRAGGSEYEGRGVLASAAAAIRRAGLTAQSLGLNAAKAVLPQGMADSVYGQELQAIKRQQDQYGEMHGMSKSLRESVPGMILSGVEQAPANIGGMLAMGGVGYPLFAGASTFGEYKFQGEEAIAKAEKQLGRALTDAEKSEVRDRFSGAEAMAGAATETVMEKLDMMFGVFSKILPQQGRKAAVKALADVLKDPKKMRPLLETAKDSAKGLAWEVGSEGLLQSGPQAAIGRDLEQQTEQQLGVTLGKDSISDAYLRGAKEGGLAAVGMWGVGAPLSVPGKYSDEKLKQRVSEIMADPAAPVAQKLQAIEEIRQRVGKISKTEADTWADQMLESVLAGQQQQAAAGTGQTAAPGGEQGGGQSVSAAPAAAEDLTVPSSQTDYEMQFAADSAQQQPVEDDIPNFSSPTVPPQQAAAVAPAVQPPAQPAGTLTRAAMVLNPYNQLATQPFAQAPEQQPVMPDMPAVRGAGTGLNTLQAPNDIDLAMEWGRQQLADPANSKFDRQNMQAMMKSPDPGKTELLRYWRAFTGQKKQPAALNGLTVARDSAPSPAVPAAVAPAEVQQPPAPVAEAPSPPAAAGGVDQIKPKQNTRRQFDPTNDDLIVAIGKLGGMDKAQVEQQWGATIADSAKDLHAHASRQGVGFLQPISRKGKPLDEIRRSLEQHGYLPEGSSINDLLAKIDSHLRGKPSYSNQHVGTVQDQDLSVAPDGVEESEYPFDLEGINFPPQRDPAKHQEYLQKQLAKAKGGKAKAAIRRALEKLEQNKAAPVDDGANIDRIAVQGYQAAKQAGKMPALPDSIVGNQILEDAFRVGARQYLDKATVPVLNEENNPDSVSNIAVDVNYDDKVKQSRLAGNVHLDQVSAAVETMRGKSIYYIHNPKQRGVVRTVDTNGNVYIYWSDVYSAEKEMASEVVENNKEWLKNSKDLPYLKNKRDGKTYVYKSVLGKSDLKDYAFISTPAPTLTPDTKTAKVAPESSPALSRIEQEVQALSLDDMSALFDEVTGAAAPVPARSVTKAKQHEKYLRKKLAESKHPNDKKKYRETLQRYLEKMEQRKLDPPKPEALTAKPEKDEGEVPFFKQGDRIQTDEGRHGEISRVSTMVGTLIGIGRGGVYENGKRYSHHYDVRWDDGILGYGYFQTMQYETDPAPEVVPAPVYKSAHIEPEQLLRNAEYKRKAARDARDAAGRARKADKISNLKAAAVQYDKEAAEMQDAFDEWAARHPEEAAKYRSAPVAAVAPADQAPAAAGDVVPGLKVAYNSQHNGIELRFAGRPTDEVIARVKAQGFKWSSKQKIWYAPKTDARQAFADALAGKEQVKVGGKVEEKPKTVLDVLKEEGAKAFADNKPRKPVDPFNPTAPMTERGKEAWLSGWDAAEAQSVAPPVFDARAAHKYKNWGIIAFTEGKTRQAPEEVVVAGYGADWYRGWDQANLEAKVEEKPSGKTIWNDDGTNGPVLITAPPADRSASDIIKAAAASGVKGADEAIKGLYELFGGASLKTFPGAIDEATYAKAKPHFVAAYRNFVAAGQGLREFFQFAAGQFGAAIKPYLMRFMEDVKNNDLTIQNSDIMEVEESGNESTSEIQSDDNGTAGVRGQVPAVGQGGRTAAGTPGTDAESVSGQKSGSDDSDEQSLSAVDGEGDTGKPGRVRQPVEPNRVEDGAGAAAGQRKRSGQDYRIPAGGLKREGSWLATARRNLEIMALTRQLAAEKRQATPSEQELLSKYTGFGASEIANNLFPGYSQHGRIIENWAKPEWRPLVDQLLALELSPEELKTLARSTQYAHYTSEGIIRNIYAALEARGFTGGKILEPGMGSGNFMGAMPDSIYANSKYTGIEMDHLTAAIAKQLYPQQNILQADYVKQKLPRDFFDLAIGNPPFADVKILADPEYKKHRFTLHDYFFAKSLDRVRPGGLMVFITSRYTMDKVDDKARAYLSERADLVGAVRFPQTAFLQHSGTEVVTDVLFLRKKQEGVESTGYAWSELAEVQTPEGPVKINQYYAEHPEMVLGKNSMKGTMYGPNQYTVLPDEGNIDDQFAAALKNLPQDIYSPPVETTRESKAVSHDRDFNPKLKKEGGIYLDDDGLLRRVEHGSGVVLSDIKKLSARDKEWLTAYIPLRDAIKQAKYDQWNDGDWQKSLKEVNRLYQAFVKQHGNLQAFKLRNKTEQDEDGNEQVVSTRIFVNDNLFKLDTEGPIVRALEVIDDNGNIKPSAFLSGRTISKPAPPKIEGLTDALAVSIDQLGKFDIDHVAKLAGMKREQALEELGDLVYQTPRGKWLMADQYLSGNVVRKLEEAKVAAAADQKYQRNVEALQKVQPKPLTHTDISVKLGATWLDPGVIEEFAAEVLEIPISVEYNPTTGKWAVSNSAPEKKDGWYYGRRGAPKAAKPQSLRQAGGEWSTEFRGPNEILDAILNNQSIKITYTDEDRKVHTDTAATAAVNEIAEKMRKRFSAWIWEDADRTQILLEEYNKRYNNIAPRKFDGSHLTLPGVSLKYKLHPHQKRAIWRVLQTGNTYLAHAVGAGKTIEMIAAGMEMKRLGQIAKPLYVVPNHMLEQFASEFQDLYPLAQIMVADSEDFHKDNRRRFMAQASMNNPDAIVITHSSFGKLGMHPKNVEQVRDEILSDMRDYLFELMEQEGEKSVKVKQMEKRLEAAEQRFDSIAVSDKADQAMTFEDLGVDFLFVDEAHEFRKLDFTTSRQVKGIDPNGSRKALDMYVKTRWLQSKRPGRSHVFASGTPITNTVGELYTLQKFFQHQQMEEDGIKHFDAWAAMFGEIEPGFEMNAAGRYEVVERFAKFDNLPELSKRVRSFMDVLTSDQLSAYVKRPDIKGGQPEIIVSHASPELKEFQQSVLLPRIERSKKWKPSFEERNNPDPIIAIIADGRLASIDMRFFNKEMKDDKNSKLNRMIDEIIKVHFETKDLAYTDKETGKPDPLKGGAQIVFYNNGLGAGAAKSRGFNAREWIMKRLKDAKIPATQVAWIDDYADADKKEAMMKEVRQGQKRILFGSAKKMGTGMNVQKRLVALHYLDPPWYPADVTQPDGRILRQGNQNELVTLQRYATKGSYDATQWQMVARKAKAIEAFLNGDDTMRSIEDLSEANQFAMASALASGDERVIQLAGLNADVERLNRLAEAHVDAQRRMQIDKENLERSITHSKQRAADLQEAVKKIGGYQRDLSGKVGNKSFDSRAEFGDALLAAFDNITNEFIKDPPKERGKRKLGTINGFDVVLTYGVEERTENKRSKFIKDILQQLEDGEIDQLPPEVINYVPYRPNIKLEITDKVEEHILASEGEWVLEATTGRGLADRLFNALNGVERNAKQLDQAREERQEELAVIKKRLGTPYPHARELAEKIAEATRLQNELAAEGQEQQPATAGTQFSLNNNAESFSGMQATDLKKEFGERVQIIQRPDQMPDKPAADAARMGVKSYNIEAFVHNGQVWLVAENIRSISRARELAFGHELAHLGQDENVVDLAVEWFKATASDKNEGFKKKAHELLQEEADKRKLDLSNPEHYRTAVREATARLAEDMASKGVKPGLIQKIVNHLRQLLRRMYGRLKITDQELAGAVAEMLRAGHKRLNAATSYSLKSEPFYSAVERMVRNAKQNAWGSAKELTSWLAGKVTADEIKQLGLDTLEGKLTKQQVLDEIAANSIEFKDVVLGARRKPESVYADIINKYPYLQGVHNKKDALKIAKSEDALAIERLYAEYEESDSDYMEGKLDETHFSQYTEPGAVDGSYREMFVTAPQSKGWTVVQEGSEYRIKQPDGTLISGTFRSEKVAQEGADNMNRRDGGHVWQDGHSQYSDIQNPVVRIRFNDREVDGKRILFIEEMQPPTKSQIGKMPDYLKNRAYAIGVKRILAYAKEHGYDGVAWTSDQQQLNRWGTERIDWQTKQIPGTHDRGKTYELEQISKGGNYLYAEYSAQGNFNGYVTAPASTKERADQLLEKYRREFGDTDPTKTVNAFTVSMKEQEGGNADGVNIEETARQRGQLLEENGTTITSKDELLALIKRNLREGVAENIADKVWKQMQDNPEGTYRPRHEFMKSIYGTEKGPQNLGTLFAKYGGEKVGDLKLRVKASLVKGLPPGASGMHKFTVPYIPITDKTPGSYTMFSLQENRLNGQPASGMIKEKEQDNGTESGDTARMQSRIGRVQAGHFEDAKALSGGVYFSIPENAQRSEVRNAEAKELRRFAEKNGLMLDAAPMKREIDLQGISGLDNFVYHQDGAYIKINKFTHAGTFTDLFINISLHNKVFPEAAYAFEGFTDFEGMLRPVFSQQGFVNDMAGEDQRRDLERMAAEVLVNKRGFARVDGDFKIVSQASFTHNDIVVRDINYRNILHYNGKVIFFDPIVEIRDAARTRENLQSLLFDDQPTVQFSLRSRVSEAASAIPWEEVIPDARKEWLRLINPLDWSRSYQLFQDWTPESIKSAFGFVGGNPEFQAERHPGMQPFVRAGEGREITRMQIMLEFLGYQPGADDTRSTIKRITDFFTKWENTQNNTDWEKLNQRLFGLTDQQRKALDLLFVEGDAMGSEYDSLGRAKMNPRIRAIVDQTAFDLYRDVRRHIDVTVRDARVRWMEHLMMQIPDMSERERDKHIAELRNRIASVRGWLPRDHGEGNEQVGVYHVFTAEDVDDAWHVSTLYDKDGEVSGEQFYLPWYPGKEVMALIEQRVKEGWQEAKVKVTTTAKGHVVLTITGDSQGAAEDISVAIAEGLQDQEVQVMRYMRRFQTSGGARLHAEKVRKDYQGAMPRTFIEGHRYVTRTATTADLSEDMFQAMKGDMALEAALKQGLKNALKRGEIDRAEYETLEQQLIQDTTEVLLSRAAGRYQIRRAPYLIEGYETEESMSLFQDYMMGTAGMLSKAAYAMQQYKNMETVSNKLRPWATRYVFDSLRNMGLADRISGDIRAFASLWYLGFRVSSAFINATQPYTQGVSELGRRINGEQSALKLIAKAQANIIKGKLSNEEKQIFDTAVYKVQEMQTALGELSGHGEGTRAKAGKLLHAMTGKALAVFQNVEVMNRKSVILASYRAFRNPDLPAGMIDEQALEKAMDVNRKVNYEMGRHNLPGWARSAAGRTFYSLQSFTWNTLNWGFNRLTSGEKRDQIALLRFAGMITLLGGAAALPGGDELDKLYRRLRNRSLKVDFQHWSSTQAKKHGTLAEMANAFAWHGLLSAGGYGVNASNAMRLQMPIVSDLLNDESLTESLSGIPGALVQKGKMTATYTGRGDYWKATESAAPEAVSGVMRAYRQATDGATTARGKAVFDEQGQQLKYSTTDAIKRGLGFQPYGQSKRSELTQQMRNIQKHWTQERNDLMDELHRVSRDKEKFGKMVKRVAEFNAKLSQSQAAGLVNPITNDAIRRRLQQRPDKKQLTWKQQYNN